MAPVAPSAETLPVSEETAVCVEWCRVDLMWKELEPPLLLFKCSAKLRISPAERSIAIVIMDKMKRYSAEAAAV